MKRNLALLLLTSILVCCTLGLLACQTGVHTHSIEKVAAKVATCETAGNIEYYRCDGCDKLFSDESYTETTLEETVIAALGHDEESHDAKAATCTEDGWDAYVTCKRDGCDYTTKVVIPALDHDCDSEVTTQPTCAEKGVRTYTCKRTGCEHTYTEDVNALGHDNKGSIAHKDATCTEAGVEGGTYCTRCNDGKAAAEKTINALGHAKKVHHEKVDATCTEAGTIEYWSCPDCNKNYSDEACTKVVTELTIAALDHDMQPVAKKDATCTETGYAAYEQCSRCDHNTKGNDIPALDHDYEDTVLEATATEEKRIKQKCAVCDDEHIQYIREAEKVVCNGNIATGGDDYIWRTVDDKRSNGMVLKHIEDASRDKPGYYYFKWSITVSDDCNVTAGINLASGADIDLSKGFPAKLNGTSIAFSGTHSATGFENYTTQILGEIALKEGENLFYIYVGDGLHCDIDYFVFTSKAALAFNLTAIDIVGYLQEAEKVVCNGNIQMGGDNEIWTPADASYSGGAYLSRVEDASGANPGHYYLKWSITAEKDCKVKVYMGLTTGVGVDNAKAFTGKLDDNSVTFSGNFANMGWDNHQVGSICEINLTAGTHTFYIYLAEKVSANIDYFVFSSNETLTFNATSVDA